MLPLRLLPPAHRNLHSLGDGGATTDSCVNNGSQDDGV